MNKTHAQMWTQISNDRIIHVNEAKKKKNRFLFAENKPQNTYLVGKVE